jgi:pyruvate, water dikinase
VTIVALRDALSEERFGGKAASLARALGAGLPVPSGFAVSWDEVATPRPGALVHAWESAGSPRVAVRSSAVGEDSIDASFAGQHVTVLNVVSADALTDAVRTIHASARTDSALAYRQRMGVAGRPRIAVVVLEMVHADVAGVLFTRNPVTGADERVIESAWGLGEAVVAGLVTPDQFRVTPDGVIVERRAGRKDVRVDLLPSGGTAEADVPAADILRLSLTDDDVLALHALALRCEEHFGSRQDLEWAFAGGVLHLLQARPITR